MIFNRASFLHLSDSGGIQTHNLLIRSQMLYSVELRSHPFCFAGAKVRTFLESTKLFPNFFQEKLEIVGESQRRVFLELPIAEVVIPNIGVVEAREEEEIGGDVLRHAQ